MRIVFEEVHMHYVDFHKRLQNQPNSLVEDLSILILPGNLSRRLKSEWYCVYINLVKIFHIQQFNSLSFNYNILS